MVTMVKQMVEEQEASLEDILKTIKSVISGETGENMSQQQANNDKFIRI